MKTRRKLGTRICSIALAACILLGLLPMSAIIALATVEKPVSVMWEPRTQTEDGVVAVDLSATLTQSEGGPAAAMIEITLEGAAAEALRWSGESISVDELVAQDTGKTPPDATDPDQTEQDETDTGASDSDETVTEPSVPNEPGQDDGAPDDPATGGSEPDEPNTGEGDTDEPTTGGPDADVSNTDDPSDVTAPTGADPDVPTPSEADPDTTDPTQTVPDVVGPNEAATETAVPDAAETAGETGTIAGTLTLNDAEPGSQAVLITDVEDGGAVLRILLVGDSHYEGNLTFTSENEDTEVSVQGAILVQTYSVGSIPDMKAPLLESGIDNVSIETTDFTVYADIPEEIDVSAESPDINLDDDTDKPTIPYLVKLQKTAAGSDGKNYTFTVELPNGLALPEGALTSTAQSGDETTTTTFNIQCGGTVVATLQLPKGLSLADGTLLPNTSDNGFSFTVSVPKAEFETPAVALHEIPLTLYAGELTRSTDAISGSITLTVSAENDADTSRSAFVTVTAGANFPGHDDWNVVVSDYESVTQQIYWADNNDVSGRPNWSRTLGDTSEGTMTPKLYFTLTQVNEDGSTITFTRQELTRDNLDIVGLADMPTVDYNKNTGVLSVNAAGSTNGLPTELVEQDGNGNELRHYTVSWSLEPPDTIPGGDYTLQDIEDPSSVDGVEHAGWYFVRLQDFTVTLDVQQGIARELTDTEVQALLENFSFHWDYDGMPDGAINQNTLADMLENGLNASYENGKITISGLWEYSISGTPITYYLTETADDAGEGETTADGRLSGGELPESLTGENAPLDENDWYSILYNNTGVPNAGNESTAVYNEGTLTLVRGGETTYTAYKVWMDSYEQNPEDSTVRRPDVTFTLYRYLRSEGIHTASNYAGEDGAPVEVILVWVEDAAGDGGDPTDGTDDTGSGETTGGEDTAEPAGGRWEIQVVYADGENKGELAALPQYDGQSGSEWIYVVRETLDSTYAGQYEQQFGEVTWDDESDEWVVEEDDLADWGLTERAPNNTYLYNGDTLTNLQSNTVSASATKVWKAANFQSGFDNVVVELTLQVHEAGQGDGWRDYTDESGNTITRYLYDFSAVKLTDTLTDRLAMPQYSGNGDRTQELEYRWLETAVYTGVPDEKSDLSGGTRFDVSYPEDSVTETSSCTSDNPTGTIKITGESRSYAVSYDGETITNSVQDTVSYEVIKEWHGDSLEKAKEAGNAEITLQIFRAVTGGVFNYETPYLEITMDGTNNQESVSIKTAPLPSDAPEVEVSWGISDSGYTPNNQVTATWPATVTGLPAYDADGQAYEYILLELTDGNVSAVYENRPTDTADYRTAVINGGPGKGFNLLVRKTWLDNSDTPHREPVTFTLYNKTTNKPVLRAGSTEENPSYYTITLGPDIWSSVVWIGDSEIATESKYSPSSTSTLSAENVYLVETSVGDVDGEAEPSKVNHYTDDLSYKTLYQDGHGEDDKIFDVTTKNHRYQVTYDVIDETDNPEEGTLPGGVDAAFTITNRRLGNINLTVNKHWVDGRTRDGGEEVSDTTLSDEIGAALEEIYSKDKTRLALVFRLVFDESMGKTEEDDSAEIENGTGDNWEITYSGPYAGTDTVSVGGENAKIYGEYDSDTGIYSTQVSSEQTIIGVDKNGEAVYSNTAHFYGLPKYDSDGNAVAYSVEEVWLDVTEAAYNGKEPEVVDLEKRATEDPDIYGDLYALWSDYTDPEFEWDYENNVDGKHTLDIQTLDVTNRRNTPKNVSWTKVWMDNYTNESGLRPDLYLDIYRVVHVAVNDALGNKPTDTSWTPTYQRQIEYVGSSGDWQRNGDNNTWTLTLENVAAFDRYGYEIYYYAVERTTQPADRYDYQAGKYSLDSKDLGTRDEAAEGADILSADTEQKSGDHAYELLVLGKQDENDTTEIGSIQWAEGHRVQGTIGPFGNGSNYAKYALVENGTFTNTLAEEYSINGMKYWTNLSGWDTETRLPGVKFLVYRYTQDTKTWEGDRIPDTEIQDAETGNFIDNSKCKYYAAQLTISPEQWSQLKSGNGYQYQILYKGTNILTFDEKGSPVWDVEEGETAVPLERYDENGNLYTYEIREVVQWADENNDLSGDAVFTVSQAGNGFYFTNKYDPDTGSIQVKKFLYLPKDSDDKYVFPAVTFKLTRQVTYGGDDYDPDTSFETRTVTISSLVVQQAWEDLDADGQAAEYVALYATFEDLPLYAPNGTAYQYTVIEDRDELKGYETRAESGDKPSPEEVTGMGVEWTPTDSAAYPNSGITDGIQISGLTPTHIAEGDTETKLSPAATFKNEPSNNPETYKNAFTATKEWDDNNNAYGFRPDTEKFKTLLMHKKTDETGTTWASLKRTAASQTGQHNGMTEYLIAGVDYELIVTSSGNDTYAITIEPMGTNAFELYAPNGMPWVYSLSEPVTNNNRLQINLAKDDAEENNIYAPPADTGGTWKTTIRPTTGAAAQNTDFGSLTNTTHMEYKFSKEWVDENGDKITENYLGEDFKLTVSFQLQVSADNKATWQDASEYFKNQGINTYEMEVTGTGVEQGTGDAWDTATITATVDAAVWGTGGTFTKLPTVLKIDGRYTLLQYRVIETSVTYNGITQEIKDLNLDNAASGATTTGSYTVDTANGSLVSGATFTRYNNAGKSTSTNKLETTSVSVTKVWDDTDNQYGTRPGADEPWTWGSWFVLQRSTTPSDDTSWQNVAVFEKLYGNNAESANDTDPDSSGRWTDTITGLPTMDYSGENAEPYTYRVRELQPKDGGYSMTDEESINDNIVDDVEPGNVYNPNGSTYTTTYQESPENYWTVTNALDLYTPDGKVTEITAKKVWAVPSTDETAKPSVTFQLQYCTESGNWTEAPFDNAEQLASSDNNWTVLWEDLPTTIGGEEVTYQVVELDENGWVQIDQPIQLLSGGEAEYTFINTFARDYTVEKKWNPGTAEAQNVTVWLYRTTNPAQVGSSSEARVPENEMVPGSAFLEATLNNGNSWSVTFQGLPKYDASGRLYYYYALELNGTTPIPQNGSITFDETSYEVSYDWTTSSTQTTVTNTTATSLTGTKTWVDNDNAYHTRPQDLDLILERRVGSSGNWTDVSHLYSPTWTKPETGNTWIYRYTGLPSRDANGAEYTYRVREVVPAGYGLRGEVTPGQGDVKPDTNNRYHFINVLTGTVTISGQKIWNGGVEEGALTLKLERRLSGSTDETAWTEVTVTGQPTWVKNGNTWTYTYTDLPKYNEDGVLYEYRVRENPVPDGYEDGYRDGTAVDTPDIPSHPDTPVDGLTITNYKDGSLTVSKTVSGNRGDQNKDFTFTVKLTGSSSAGTAASDVDDSFNTTKTDADGNATPGTIIFTDGVSGEFTLKHGESITIQGLPAGIGYEVVEKEMDQNGYRTSGTGWTGEIPAGGTASAAFENYRHDSGGGDDDRIDLTGTKTWVDDGENDSARPVSITLYLFRQISGGPEERVYAQPTWVKNGNTWTYTFHDLPEEDENGNKYTYFVQEKVPEGYQPTYDGNNITNRKSDTPPGSLQVSKRVTGSAGDPTREFTFTVILSNRNLTGIYGQMSFVNGVATFTLHDGETILAENLPDGITYTVTEAEADQDGYSTTASGDTGTITAGGTVSAVFTNHRPGSDPDDPDEPVYPDEPDYPDDPDRPDEPDTPDTPSNPDTPRTGDPTHNGLLALLCLLSLGGMAVVGLPRLLGRKYRGKRLR